ncbi:MAG TPA: HEAT repeat domain-containing protein [bacterium]|nr:HEAT repeat domain-containing protein [bacterium]
MKLALRLLLPLLLAFLGSPARAFLASADPDNFFLLLESAPIVAAAKWASTEAPAPNRPFYLHELKKISPLRGEFSGDRFKVAEEVLVPGQKPAFGGKEEVLVLLAPVPDFTAYREFRSRGYVWRSFGGKRGVWPAAAIPTAQAYLAAAGAERNAVLLKLLSDAANPMRREAVLLLARRGPLPLTGEEAQSLTALAQGADAPLAAAAVGIMEKANNAASSQALLKLAAGPSSPAKWEAIRALERKGQPRPVSALAEDYRGADARGQAQALSLIAAKRDAEAAAFFSDLLAGSSAFEAKREAIQKMAEKKTPAYERLLIGQIGGAEESIQAEAILALGRMGSTEAVPRILPLLDSSSEKLRGAAFFMLMDSPDPRAQALMSQRYERDHHGGWNKNPHFHNIAEPKPIY